MKLPNITILFFSSAWLCSSATATDFQNPLMPTPSPTPFNSSPSIEALLSLHRNLVERQSISNHEADVTAWLLTYLTSHNLTVETQPVGSLPGRANIYAYIGDVREARVLITSHIDTVPPFWPYERRANTIWGRGSVDAKGSVAAQITAVLELIAAKALVAGDIALLFVVGEEVGGDGMRRANDLGVAWDAVIFGEPTELRLARGHKGIVSFDIVAKGRAAHSGYPELGQSAVAMLVPALNALLHATLPASERFGNSTLNIGRVEAGVAANVIPEHAEAAITVRIADGLPADIEKIVRDIVAATGEELVVTFSDGYGPVDIDSDVPGFDTVICNYGTDIPNLLGDHKRYLYGPGSILLAHSDHEHLNISDLVDAVAGYKLLILHSLTFAS